MTCCYMCSKKRFYEQMSSRLTDRPEKSCSASPFREVPACRNTKTAFTLTEVLVAMLLSVLAVASTYKLLTHSRNTLRSAANRLEAMNTARAGMEYLRTLDFNDSMLEVDDHSMELNGQSFDYEVVLYDSDDSIKQITVTVEWESVPSGNEKQFELVSLLSSPLH